MRKTEQFWRKRSVNVRSTLWDGPRGGAPFYDSSDAARSPSRTKVLGCGTIRDKAGRMRDKPRILLGLLRRRRPTGGSRLLVGVFPHLAIFEGGLRRLRPL